MKRALGIMAVALAAVCLTALPASAHQNSISATVECINGQQVVAWFNTGDAARFGVAVITASNRPAVAINQTVPPVATVQVGQETFPADASGPITLTETWTWVTDLFQNTNSYTVILGIDCASPSPTTPPPTTVPPTTPPPTTVPPTTPPPTTVPPTSPDPTCIPRPPGKHIPPNPDYCQPNTGADASNLLWWIGGLVALATVAFMVTRKRVLD